MTVNTEIAVRQATPDDEAALQRFYRQAYGEERSQYKYPLRWNWLYRENPFIPKGFGLPIWVAVRHNEIVGHTGAMFVPCLIKEKSVIAAWSVDTIILPSYRGIGLGKRLQKSNQDSHEIFMSLAMSPANRAIKKKLGARPGPAAGLYVHTTEIDADCLFKGINIRLRKRLGDLWGEPAWQLLYLTGLPWLFTKYLEAGLRKLQKEKQSRVREHSREFTSLECRFGDEADQLWESCRGLFNFMVERTSAYLNWKYVDQPHIRYERFYATDGSRPVGLVVFRLCEPPEPKLGVISEMICSHEDEDLVLDMLCFARERLYIHHGVLGIYIACSLPHYQRALKNLGFLNLSSQEMCLFDRSQQAGTTELPWKALLAKGDHDWDQYPLTRQISISEIMQIFRNVKGNF